MMVTPNAQTRAQQAPRWLRVLAGILLFLVLWVGMVLALDAVVPLMRAGGLAPVVWLAPTGLLAALAAWGVVRRAPARSLIVLLPISVLVCALPLVWPSSPAPKVSAPSIGASAPTPGETGGRPPEAQPPPRETAEIEPRRRGEFEERQRLLEEARRKAEEAARRQAEEAELQRKRAEEEARRVAERERKAAESTGRPRAGVEPAPPPPPPSPTPPGSAGAGSALPQFPWPPPSASASYVLPADLFAGHTSTGQVVASIIAALERKGYAERAFFATPADGVALVTRIERINEDGSSAVDVERWPVAGEAAKSSAGLAQFLRGLFYVDPGRYRVIVFILQDTPFHQSSERITGQQARSWLRSGANVLPRELAERAYSGNCTALVYEFASDGSAVRVVESRLTGRQHLDKAGVLAALGRAN